MPESLQHCRTLARGFLYFWANASAKSMPKGWNLMRYRSVSAASLPISSSSSSVTGNVSSRLMTMGSMMLMKSSEPSFSCTSSTNPLWIMAMRMRS